MVGHIFVRRDTFLFRAGDWGGGGQVIACTLASVKVFAGSMACLLQLVVTAR